MEIPEIERLIRISKEKPLLPETYVPWSEELQPGQYFLPSHLTSLEGLSLYQTLSDQQRLELGRHEVVQVMYSYAWGEGLFCLFMNKYILNLPPDNVEYRFLLRELIEEFRHQEMFTQTILRLGGKPIPISRSHKLIGNMTTKLLPTDCLFMGSLSIEIVSDRYGNYGRKDPLLYGILRKVFELHNIEEARHIVFTKNLLKRYTDKAGPVRRTVYSFVVLLNVYFLRTLYVKKEIYQRIGLENPQIAYKLALKNYKEKFTQSCLPDIIEFVDSWHGFNRATRWAWRRLMGAKV
ncbi:MAG: diiron oxygenase [Bacteroidetes bacterium]|nr:diiron oxygenase [Bacteroidota bacterium]